MSADWLSNSQYSDDGFEFRFLLEGPSHRIRSVAIIDGVPEFRFDTPPHPHFPALTEKDVADAFRLALEGRRPEFFYVPIPPPHPFFGRQFKQYIPEWIQGTSIGETLSETDWAMKSLANGLKSNASKTEFWAWEKTSQLTGLATSLDFERDKPSGSVIMSCKSLSVRKSENELEFVGEPHLHINDECSAAYSRYINRILPSVAYHDETLFLRFAEVVKLVVAAEWVVERGVKISRRWLEEHSNRTKVLAVPSGSVSESATPPAAPIITSQSPTVREEGKPEYCEEVPTKDVSIKRSEAKHCNRHLEGRERVKRLYGFCDPENAEMVVSKADGTPRLQMKSMKCVWEQCICEDGKVVEARKFKALVPIPPGAIVDDSRATSTDHAPVDLHSSFSYDMGPHSLDIRVANSPKAGGEDVTMTMVAKEEGSERKTITVVRGSTDNYDLLYKGLDPNTPVRPEIPGECEAVTPNVRSWNELHSKTVPWPQVWIPNEQEGLGVFMTSMGGVTTSHIPVVEEKRREDERRGSRSMATSVIKGVQGTCSRQQGKISRMTLGMSRIVEWFRTTWKEASTCPTVKKVFEIKNSTLENRWEAYKTKLQTKGSESEWHFHGTSLACDILSTEQLCGNIQCGVCGISDAGLDPRFIQTNISTLMFGEGFYFAPNSSKSHSYTSSTNGYKAMILCEVLPGRKCSTDQRRVNGPPQGCDSVEGVVGSEVEQIMVQKPEAVMPRYIIVYG